MPPPPAWLLALACAYWAGVAFKCVARVLARRAEARTHQQREG